MLLPHVLFIHFLHLLYVRDSLLFLALVDSFARRHLRTYLQVMLVHFFVNFNQMAEFLLLFCLYFFLLQLDFFQPLNQVLTLKLNPLAYCLPLLFQLLLKPLFLLSPLLGAT